MLDSDFDKFFIWLMDREGRVITNDPRDPGQQTCWGISRKYNPTWEGWKLVDKGAKASDIEPVVKVFYENLLGRYWLALKPKLREAFCDAFVNMGGGNSKDNNLDAVELLQASLNCLAGSKYVDVDGGFGNQTRTALKTENHTALAYTMCALRMAEYRRRGVGKLAYAKEGWLNRVQLLMAFISDGII